MAHPIVTDAVIAICANRYFEAATELAYLFEHGPVVDEAVEPLFDRCDRAVLRLTQLPANTPAGIRAKAQVLLDWSEQCALAKSLAVDVLRLHRPRELV